MDKVKSDCYNPIYKQTKEVMNWGSYGADIADHSCDGGGDRFPGDEDQ